MKTLLYIDYAHDKPVSGRRSLCAHGFARAYDYLNFSHYFKLSQVGFFRNVNFELIVTFIEEPKTNA